jgi:uncharacterized DUF497 family protein
MPWTITFDPAKRDWTLRERGLDFLEAAEVFAGPTLDEPDRRRDYGDHRRLFRRAYGDRLLDAARRNTTRLFDEESQ